MHAPKLPHWQVVKYIFQYLKHFASLGLHIKPCSKYTLHAFLDFNGQVVQMIGDPDDIAFLLAQISSIGAKKKKRKWFLVLALRQYKALTNTTTEILWVQSLLRDLGIYLHLPHTLWCDNLRATYLSSNAILHSRTKHIEVDFHFVRDRVLAKSLNVSFISSRDHIADSLTKVLSFQ